MTQYSRLFGMSALLPFLIFALPASAQQPMSQTMPADKEYTAAMDRMNKDMMSGMDADPTKAWAKMMIPHHQGAIDMSKTVLKSTKDTKVRKMAEKVIKDQSKEIKELQDWLKKNGG